jgi:hypothetical protein
MIRFRLRAIALKFRQSQLIANVKNNDQPKLFVGVSFQPQDANLIRVYANLINLSVSPVQVSDLPPYRLILRPTTLKTQVDLSDLIVSSSVNASSDVISSSPVESRRGLRSEIN